MQYMYREVQVQIYLTLTDGWACACGPNAATILPRRPALDSK